MDFLLDPGVTFLNHGSHGACPAPVFARWQALQRELERNPVEFLSRRFDALLEEARAELAAFVAARTEDLVFVPNATAGLNAVIRSLDLEPGDEVLTTRHEYGAVTRTWEFAGATLVHAEPDELADAIGPRTRAVSVSHITSPTALVLPVEEICAAARAAGVLSVVDGAHVPGQLPLDLERLGADVYAGNCHKWLSAPKGAGFLWARPEHQRWIEPLVVSWGYGPDRSFADRHGWQGTRDPTAASPCPRRSRRTARSSARASSRAAGRSPPPSTTACRRSARRPRRSCGRPRSRRTTPTGCSGGSSTSTGSRSSCASGRGAACCGSRSRPTTRPPTSSGCSTRWRSSPERRDGVLAPGADRSRDPGRLPRPAGQRRARRRVPDHGPAGLLRGRDRVLARPLCLESKSLKLYLAGFRNEGVFCEALAVRVRDDVAAALELPAGNVEVVLTQKARGGITITATS
ncbi:MAG: aminotransferase class V-fold PLP-dependent enzyme [Gaiellaceae bacterium]